MRQRFAVCRGAPKRGCCQAAAPFQTPQNRNLKNTDSVDIVVSRVLRDLPFSWNQTLKLADDWYIRILKDKLIKFKK
jgi:hypothetical protein